jgi:hypothetical protein
LAEPEWRVCVGDVGLADSERRFGVGDDDLGGPRGREHLVVARRVPSRRCWAQCVFAAVGSLRRRSASPAETPTRDRRLRRGSMSPLKTTRCTAIMRWRGRWCFRWSWDGAGASVWGSWARRGAGRGDGGPVAGGEAAGAGGGVAVASGGGRLGGAADRCAVRIRRRRRRTRCRSTSRRP